MLKPATIALPVLFLCLCVATAQQRPRSELPTDEGVVVLEADTIDVQGDVYRAVGQVVITYQDLTLRAHQVIYDPNTRMARLESRPGAGREVRLTRPGKEFLNAVRGDIDVEAKTGTLYDVDGFTEQELFIRAASLSKTGPDEWVLRDGVITSCDEAVPKWSFTLDRARIMVDSWTRSKNTIFKLKQIPVFYLPYLQFPSTKRERQSGFLLPSLGNSNNKGRRFSQSFYLTLGRSADLVYTQDYFSERGFGFGAIFRARPNQFTRLELDAYAVNDRLDQGGGSLNGEAETRFGGYRAVAKFNLVSSFDFRQVFSDNFFTAVRSTEASQVFISKSVKTRSVNFLASREETAFPGPNAVVRALPSFWFRVSGHRLFDSPFFADLDASATGLSRSDSQLETPGLTQRLDLFPRLYFSVPLGQGLKLTPSLGLRETFYSNSLLQDEEGNLSVSGQDFNREYLEFTLDVKGWGLSKIYRDKQGTPTWKHVVEPSLRYRYIGGIGRDFARTLLFDENDAVADTNEVEVSLTNRFFVKRRGETREWLSLKVAQKYFFDTDFGGALENGEVNQFFPLYSFTGFQYLAFARNSSPVTALARITPFRRVSFDVRTDYDPDFDRFRNFSITGNLAAGPLYLGTTYFKTQELEIGTFRRNQLQQLFAWGDLQDGLSFSGRYSYNLESDRFLNWRVRLNYFKGCCGVSVQYEGFNLVGDDGRRLRDEQALLFSFYLKGLGFFGNIERPDRIF
ncbi:MAG TPA: LPS assembly protein LptD [Acidobacteriota bacterium]|nr:LPS assembly protein LptD [Acidobacteriota bacterium]